MLIRDNATGKTHEYGTNPHDALRISEDGTCLYYENLQNGDGSGFGGGYSFVMEDGKTPEQSETIEAKECECYANIGGFQKSQREEASIMDCARKILKNTTNVFLRNILVELIEKDGNCNRWICGQ